MHAGSLLSRMRQELAPLYDELVRIRILLERIERAASAHSLDSSSDTPADPPVAATERPVESRLEKLPDAGSPAVEPPPETPSPADLHPPPSDAPVPSPHPPAAPSAAAGRLDPAQVELFTQLLALYPQDAAAVFYGFDRQHRCSPAYLDRLAVHAGLDAEWMAANRRTIGDLAARFHGGREMIAENLGRDTDSLQTLLDRIGMRDQIAAVRARERERIRNAALRERVNHILFRKRLLQDLGIFQEIEESTRQDLQGRCAVLSGECDGAQQVLDRLGDECSLDDAGRTRLLRRFDLQRFVADLFAEPPGTTRPAARRAERTEPRQKLADPEIEARILRMLLSKRKVGAAHTHIDHLVRTVPPHERGRAREIIERLLAEGILVRKVTDNSAEPHVSLAVGAVPAVEERLRGPRAAGAAPAPDALRADRAT